MKSFEILGWYVEPRSLTATKGGDEQRLTNKAMELLVFLAQHQGRVVTHEEIEQHVWGGNSYVAKKGATNTIWQLRKALQVGLEADAFIETIPKRGYRLNSEVLVHGENNKFSKIHISIITAVFGFAAVFFAVNAWFPEKTDLAALQRVILTDYPGEETEPALSKDGQRLAFVWVNNDRQPDIYWKYTFDSSLPPFRLTNTPADEAVPSWSPDGQHIAFLRFETGTRRCSLFILSIATQVERHVTECQATIPGTLAWSPDGQWLAYAYVDEKSHGIGIVRPDGSDVRKLTKSPNLDMPDTSVAWSLNSQSIAFTRRSQVEVDELHIVDLDGTSRRLTGAPTEIFGVSWSFDPEALIVAAMPEGEHRMQLLQIDAVTGAVKGKLDQGVLEAYVPTLSYDGKLLAYDASNFVVGVGKLSEDAERVEAISTIASLSTDREPDVSVTGAIAFTSTRTGTKEVWVYEKGQELPKQVTSFGVSNVFGPTWSPDGKYLSFLAPGQEGKLQIFLLEYITKKLFQLTSNPTDHMPPSWAPDGRSILAAERIDTTWTIHRYSLGEDKVSLDKIEPIVAGYVAKQSKDNTLYTFRLDDGAIFKVADGKEVLFLEGMARRDWGNWALAEQGVYAVLRLEKGDQLVLQPYSAAKPEEVALLSAGDLMDQNSMAYDAVTGNLLLSYYAMQQADIFGLQVAAEK